MEDPSNFENNSDGTWSNLFVTVAKFFMTLKYENNLDQPTLDTININFKNLILQMIRILKVRTLKIKYGVF